MKRAIYMQTTATPNYLPAPARPQLRNEAGRELESVLHDLIALALTGRRLSWTVIRKSAHSLHLEIDQLTEGRSTSADTVAERAATLGYSVDGQTAAVTAEPPLSSVPAGKTDDTTVIHQIGHRTTEFSERTGERVGAMDLISQDVLVDIVSALESDQWSVWTQASKYA